MALCFFGLVGLAFLRGLYEVIPTTAFAFWEVAASRYAGVRVIRAVVIIVFPIHSESSC